MPIASSPSVSGNRVARHRASTSRIDVSVPPALGSTLDGLAAHFGCHKSEVVRCLLRFALTNRDWRSQGLIWRDV